MAHAIEVSKGLTPAERAVLNFIVGYASRMQATPTFREIGNGVGTSYVTARTHVKQLERKGFVNHTPNVARGIQLVGRCPCCGSIVAREETKS